mmetsp:Transcript_52661/g.132454  ORF Transcript_52661/g.132454 Transcript_52661/m.132454 type:complete len:233 (+) Transcript_52661:1296-1994(+)
MCSQSLYAEIPRVSLGFKRGPVLRGDRVVNLRHVFEDDAAPKGVLDLFKTLLCELVVAQVFRLHHVIVTHPIELQLSVHIYRPVFRGSPANRTDQSIPRCPLRVVRAAKMRTHRHRRRDRALHSFVRSACFGCLEQIVPEADGQAGLAYLLLRRHAQVVHVCNAGAAERGDEGLGVLQLRTRPHLVPAADHFHQLVAGSHDGIHDLQGGLCLPPRGVGGRAAGWRACAGGCG